VTDEAPYKLISKQVFLDDVQKRAAVSDFSPFKKEIANAELDEILVVYDADFLYGQNFFLIMTNDAKLKYLYPNGPPADPDALPAPGGQDGGAAEGEEEEDLNEIFVSYQAFIGLELRIVQTKHILFLKSLSERVGPDIKRL